MTLFDVEELSAYWQKHPPVHILVAAYLGVGVEKGKRRLGGPDMGPGMADASDMRPVTAEEAMAALGAAPGMVGGPNVFEGFDLSNAGDINPHTMTFEDMKRLNENP